MINQQLLDYVREQLSGGLPKEGIKRELAIQGWDEQNVNEVFTMLEKSSQAPVSTAIPVSNSVSSLPLSIGEENKIWSKSIPGTNIGFMVVSLLLVFVLDLGILIASPGLWGFYVAMLIVISIFAGFFYFEKNVLKKRFLLSHSKLDSWFFGLVILRNLVFLLNFIPLIQIAGGMALVFGGIPYIIIYCIILKKRWISV